MLCVVLSLLTKATWLPRGTLTFFGLTVLLVMVMVAAAVLGLGELDALLQAIAAAAPSAARNEALM
jgi:hypothetical protein